MISIMKKNKFLLLPCTLLVVGLMTLSFSFEGRAQDKIENLRKVWNGTNQEQTNPGQSKSNQTSISRSSSSKSNPTQRSRTSQTSTPQTSTPNPGASNPDETENDNTPSPDGAKGFLNQNNQGNEAKGADTVNKIINNFNGNQGGGEGPGYTDKINKEFIEEQRIESSRLKEEKLEQQIDSVYNAGMELKAQITKAEEERDRFSGAGMKPRRAEEMYSELDIKCLELRSQYEILVLRLEELQEEYDKVIGE